AVLWAAIVFVLVRFGLLAAVTAWTLYELLFASPLTSDLSAWYAGASLSVLPWPASASTPRSAAGPSCAKSCWKRSRPPRLLRPALPGPRRAPGHSSPRSTLREECFRRSSAARAPSCGE